MFNDDGLLGCPCGFQSLRENNNKLNAEVEETVNDTQELIMLNDFAHECNEYQYRKCLEERISDIESWRWVFRDLTRRIDDALSTLNREKTTLEAVIERVKNELVTFSVKGSKPGALCPNSDEVENSIIQEHNFLRDHKKKFEKIAVELNKQIRAVQKTRKTLEIDILKKQKSICVDKECANLTMERNNCCSKKKNKKKSTPLEQWERRCLWLKKDGLRALSRALTTRQQVRAERVHLSIAAQAFATKVDTALRKRLHTNRLKLEELQWQRNEADRDIKSLDEELEATERSLLDNMSLERNYIARLADRNLKPRGEMTRDEVDKRLREELARLRNFAHHLRCNINRISALQRQISDAISRIDCCFEDVLTVMKLDMERIRNRSGEEQSTSSTPTDAESRTSTTSNDCSCQPSKISCNQLRMDSIREEDEEDDYPFED